MAKLEFNGEIITNDIIESVSATLTHTKKAAMMGNGIAIPSSFNEKAIVRNVMSDINQINRDLENIHSWLNKSNNLIKYLNSDLTKSANVLPNEPVEKRNSSVNVVNKEVI